MQKHWRELLGGDGVLDGAVANDWAVAGRKPSFVLFPQNTEQVVAIVHRANEERLPLEPAGGGTFLYGGRASSREQVVVSTRRMNQVLEYESADLTMSLQAGVTLAEANARTRKERQHIALDAPARPRATIGATAALSASGPMRLAYGTPRDQVLGLQVVTGDGRVIEVGGKVVKNVAGYDITRLMIGSNGTLGVITQVHVRLRSLPARDVTFAISGQPAGLIEAAQRLATAPFEPVALELVLEGGRARLLVRIHGNEDVVANAAAQVEKGAQGLPVIRLDDKSAAAEWILLSEAGAQATFCVRLAALPVHASRILHDANTIAGGFLQATIALHAGTGVARVYSIAQPANETPAAIERAREDIRSLNGSVIVTVAPPEMHSRMALRPAPGAQERLMRGLKQVFDPSGILAPERFIV